MKKFIILLCLLILLGGCGEIQVTSQSVAGICGDNVCTVDEDCNCQDCKKELKCIKLEEQAKQAACDDDNPCTQDTYYKNLGCIHETIENCCGNNICEPGERCNQETHKTNCVQDCNLNCPAVVVIHKNINDKGINQEVSFTCAGGNCIDKGNNNFELKGSGSIMTVIENLGEFLTKQFTSSFNCRTELGVLIASRDNQENKGIIFSDFFNNNQDSLDYIEGNTKLNNFAIYQLKFNVKELEKRPFNINCGVNLNSVTFTSNQRVFITFN